ncbi:MAG: hypothetical protein NTW33_00435 [Methanoregula sp.]|nr:hypothetical protein [Methanoregula sp.]
MKPESRDYGFLAVLAAVVIGITVWSASPVWYLTILLLCLFCVIWYGVRTWHDRAFYLVCAGEPLIVTCCYLNLWVGLFVVWMVAGIVCNAMGILELPFEIRLFFMFCGVTVPVAALVQVSNHVVLPLLILCIGTGLILGIQAIRDYTFKKQYSGVRP